MSSSPKPTAPSSINYVVRPESIPKLLQALVDRGLAKYLPPKPDSSGPKKKQKLLDDVAEPGATRRAGLGPSRAKDHEE